MLKDLIEQTNLFFSKESYVNEHVFDLLVEVDMENADFLELLTDLMYSLYVKNEREKCLDFYPFFEKIAPMEDKRLWGWIEFSLLLFAVIFKEKGDETNHTNCISKIEEGRNVGNEMVISINKKASTRRMAGSLLCYDDIEEALSEGDQEEEYIFRLIQLKELFYIKALGYSESMTQNKTDSEIVSNIEALEKLI